MSGMSPVVWNHAEGFQVRDGYGNKWIDFTSSVVLTNAGGGYSAPYPVINVREISNPKQPVVLIRDLALDKSYEYKRYEILFSRKYPKGKIIEEKQCPDC